MARHGICEIKNKRYAGQGNLPRFACRFTPYPARSIVFTKSGSRGRIRIHAAFPISPARKGGMFRMQKKAK